MKKSKYFRLEELVPPEIFKSEGENAWNHLSSDLIDSIDGLSEFLHEKLNTEKDHIVITINNWLWVKVNPLTESGYRIPATKTGAPKSEHKLGNAVDAKVKGFNAGDIQKLILQYQDDPRLLKITRMEANPPTSSWTHIDCEVLGPNVKRIHVFIP
jgi:hypothetical protein